MKRGNPINTRQVLETMSQSPVWLETGGIGGKRIKRKSFGWGVSTREDEKG